MALLYNEDSYSSRESYNYFGEGYFNPSTRKLIICNTKIELGGLNPPPP